jgi:hypothetical protein
LCKKISVKIGAATFRIMTLSITILSVKGLFTTLSITNSLYQVNAECRNADCKISFIVMLIVIKLSVEFHLLLCGVSYC